MKRLLSIASCVILLATASVYAAPGNDMPASNPAPTSHANENAANDNDHGDVIDRTGKAATDAAHKAADAGSRAWGATKDTAGKVGHSAADAGRKVWDSAKDFAGDVAHNADEALNGNKNDSPGDDTPQPVGSGEPQ